MGIAADELESISCTCGGVYWEELMVIKRIPAMISENGREQLAPMPVFVCSSCKEELSASQAKKAEAKSALII